MVPIEQKICVKAPVDPEISMGLISEIVIGMMAVYIPMQAPWMILMMIKQGILVMKSKDPATRAQQLMKRM